MPKEFTKSPQDTDPLSWFSGPKLPIVFALVAVTQGLALTLATWEAWPSIPLQFAAMACFALAGYLAAFLTKPQRRRFGPGQAGIVLGTALIGVALSAAGTSGQLIPVEQWWAPIAMSILFVALAPYASARELATYLVPVAAVTGVLGAIVYLPHGTAWAQGTLLLIVGPVLSTAAAAAVFSYWVVRSNRIELQGATRGRGASALLQEELRRSESEHLARMSARVAPVLIGIAEAGVITDADRSLAGQLARRLRTDVKATAESSWLDVLAHDHGLKVSDSERLAKGLNEEQRGALGALLVAVLESEVIDSHTVLIELRRQNDGSTAVALSMDVDLPEGRRLMLLAPYYLALKTTVDNLSWDGGRSTILKFQVPPQL